LLNSKIDNIKPDNKKNIKNLIEVYIALARIYKSNNKLKEALKCYETLIPLNVELKKWDSVGWEELEIGNIYFNGRFYLSAVKNYNKAANSFRKCDEKYKFIGLAVCYQNIGIAESKRGNYKVAMNFFKKAKDSRGKTSKKEEFADLYNFIGDNCISQEKFDSARIFYNKSISIDIDNERYVHLVQSYQSIANLEFVQNNLTKSIEFYKKAYSTAFKVDDFNGITTSGALLGRNYQITEQTDSAIKYLMISLAFANDITNYKDIRTNCNSIIRILKSKGVEDKVLLPYKELIDKANATMMAENEWRYELEEEIKNRNIEISLNIEKQKIYKKALIVSVALSIVFLFMLIIIAVNRKNIKAQKERLKLTLKQLSEVNDQLEDINKHQERSYSIVAHDLKNSLGGSLSMLELLKEEDLDKKDKEYYMKLITKAVHQTYNLMIDLLSWSRVNNHSIKFKPEPINLELRTNINIDFIRETSFEKNINITFEAQKECNISGDREMIDAILRNVLDNAIKFTHKGGKIDVKISKTDKYAIITIEDNGVGMDDHQIENLFDIREFDARIGTNNEKGSGLGLKLVYKFVKINNGDILVKSELLEGTTFTIIFPLLKE
jgi:signal transduction histidine kinase